MKTEFLADPISLAHPGRSTSHDGSSEHSSPDGSAGMAMFDLDFDQDQDNDLDGEDDVDGLTRQVTSQAGPVRKSRRPPSTAERKATHNAVERARRESLNGRFMELATALPTMSHVKRPSKAIIVNKSLEYIYDSRAREASLVKENDLLRTEINELRARLNMTPLSLPARVQTQSALTAPASVIPLAPTPTPPRKDSIPSTPAPHLPTGMDQTFAAYAAAAHTAAHAQAQAQAQAQVALAAQARAIQQARHQAQTQQHSTTAGDSPRSVGSAPELAASAGSYFTGASSPNDFFANYAPVSTAAAVVGTPVQTNAPSPTSSASPGPVNGTTTVTPVVSSASATPATAAAAAAARGGQDLFSLAAWARHGQPTPTGFEMFAGSQHLFNQPTTTSGQHQAQAHDQAQGTGQGQGQGQQGQDPWSQFGFGMGMGMPGMGMGMGMPVSVGALGLPGWH